MSGEGKKPEQDREGAPEAVEGAAEAVPELAPEGAPEAAQAAAEAAPEAAHTAAAEAARRYAGDTVGLGIDIVEIARMEHILEQSPAFEERTFSQAERDYCNSKANPATHFAMRFAAKEAVAKALGTGFAEGVGVRDVEVGRTKGGKPVAVLSGGARTRAEQLGVRELSLSLSYTHTEAVACAMAVTDAAVRASEKRKDPMEELTRQFKETRGILDEL